MFANKLFLPVDFQMSESEKNEINDLCSEVARKACQSKPALLRDVKIKIR